MGHITMPKAPDFRRQRGAGEARDTVRRRVKPSPEAIMRANGEWPIDDRPLLSDDQIDDELRSLALLTPLAFEQQRTNAAERLGLRVGVLTKLVQQYRNEQ